VTRALRFGAFIAPFHGVADNPTAALERDLRLVEHLDALGLAEAWFGEHHSGGSETIGSPEVVIAAAAARTKWIRLGTGVISVPYHHPLLVADRIVLLDHLTRGRAMFGFGPGALPSDAFMMGIDPKDQRRMLQEALPAIIALLRGETVDLTTDWFVLREARLQLAPFTAGLPELAVASMLSPTGPALAGRLGAGLLSLTVASPSGSGFLANHWKVAADAAADAGRVVDRFTWRCVAPVHIAPTREEARADVRFGLHEWITYFRDVAALPIGLADHADGDPVDTINATGLGVVGSPEDAIEFIERVRTSSGGFGTFLVMAHDWAAEDATRRSYELLARAVAPAFVTSPSPAERSRDFLVQRRAELMGDVVNALSAAIRDHYGRPLDLVRTKETP